MLFARATIVLARLSAQRIYVSSGRARRRAFSRNRPSKPVTPEKKTIEFYLLFGMGRLSFTAHRLLGLTFCIVFFDIFAAVVFSFAAHNRNTELDIPRFIIHFNWHYCQPFL